MGTQYVFGEFVDVNEIDEMFIDNLIQLARTKQNKLLSTPVRKIVDLFGKISDLWKDPNSQLREEALAILPGETGLSNEMVLYAINHLAWAIESDGLYRKLKKEICDIDLLDLWKNDMANRQIRYHPLGILLQVISGNVLVGGAFSLALGCITKNVNIIKTSSMLQQFPLLFAKSICSADTENILRDTFAILNWKGGTKQIEDKFKQVCDGFIVWGGEDVVQNYRIGRRNSSRLVEFGPKVSLGFVSEEGWCECNKANLTLAIARDIALWDQQSCSSPQVIFVQGKRTLTDLLPRLEEALRKYEMLLPRGDLDFDEEAELCREREVAKFDQALGEVKIISKVNDMWCIIVDYTKDYRLSPLKRTIYLKLVPDIQSVYSMVGEYKDYLQTIGICVSVAELTEILNAFVALGATRIAQFGKMVESDIDDPHDGLYATNHFVKVVGMHYNFDNNYYENRLITIKNSLV